VTKNDLIKGIVECDSDGSKLESSKMTTIAHCEKNDEKTLHPVEHDEEMGGCETVQCDKRKIKLCVNDDIKETISDAELLDNWYLILPPSSSKATDRLEKRHKHAIILGGRYQEVLEANSKCYQISALCSFN
jgi:hypothetical protein